MISYETNAFGGAVLDPDSLPDDPALYTDVLAKTLVHLQSEDLSLAWIFLPLNKAFLVGPTVSLGFEYHHADEKGLELFFRIKKNAFIPGYATHYVGAGGVLVDDKNRILVIQERHHTRRHYKLPGGALDPDEHIAEAVVREVLEETGIQSEFLSLNCFRHWHGYRYGKSDIYFVCRLKPLSNEIIIDPSEISEAIWMPLDEYLSHPETHPFNRKIVSTTVSTAGLIPEELEGYGTPATHEMLFARH